MIWFNKTNMLSQAIFTFPVIGYITGYQAIIIFGLGLPMLFATMQITGDIIQGSIPLIVCVVFSMIRPPVMSYEGRLFVMLKFLASGGYGVNQKSKSKVLGKYSKTLKKASNTVKPQLKPDLETIQVKVFHGSPVEISITLKTRAGNILSNQKVRILFDDIPIKTAFSSSSGQIHVLLDADQCIGKKSIFVCEIKQDDTTGTPLVQREIEFLR